VMTATSTADAQASNELLQRRGLGLDVMTVASKRGPRPG